MGVRDEKDTNLFLNQEFGLLDRYEMQAELVGALEKTEYHRHLAGKVFNCHKKFRHKRCENNHSWAKADNSCSVRLCPHCSHRKVRKVGSKVQQFVVGKPNLKYLVLAEANSESLEAGVKSLWESWNKLRRSVFWKGKVIGAIAVLEVTWSKKRRDWHPHLNVLFEGEYIPFQQLNLIWRDLTEGRGRTTRISKADEGTVFELIKYTLKVAEYADSGEGRVLQLLFDDPRVLDEFLSAIYGMRVIRTYGSFRSMGDVEAEEEECPDCGSTCIVDLGRVSHQQLSFDFEKEVFRVTCTVPEVRWAYLRTVEFDSSGLNAEIERQRARVLFAVESRRETGHYEKRIAGKFSRQLAA